MCGIPGWVSLGLDLNREQPTLDEMTETMACREPAVPGSTSGTASTRSATGGSPDTSRRSTNSAASQLCRSVIRWARTGLDAMSGAAVRVGVGTRFYYDGEGVEVVEMLSSPSVHIPDQRSTETYPNHTGPWVLPTRCSYAVGYPLMRCSTELSSVGWDLLVGYCVEELAPLWIPRDLLQVHCHDLAVQFGIHVVREVDRREFREVGEDPEIAVKVNRVVQVALERRQVVDSVTRAPQRRVGALAMHGKPEVEG
jgi:hypothetical protein